LAPRLSGKIDRRPCRSPLRTSTGDHGQVLRLAVALFAIQAGFHGFTAALPLALAQRGVSDPEIGLVVGAAAVVQFPAAFVAGALVDRFGGRRLMAGGALAYLCGASIILALGVDPATTRLPLLVARVFQGIGIATTLPAALSLVPNLVESARRGFALAFVGSAHNLTLVLLPPLSLAVLAASSLTGVAAMIVVIVIAGLLVAFLPVARGRPPDGAQPTLGSITTDAATSSPTGGSAPTRPRHGPVHALRPAKRKFGFAFRLTWLRPLAITLLYVAHWGVITAYLPQRAHAAGADVGLFFVADGLAILLLRVPSGWLADRMPPRRLILVGLALTAIAIGLLLLPPTTVLLVAAGLLTGAGGGLILTPLLLEMSHLSAEEDRGSAFALFSGALAGALVLGSIGGAPIIALAGFEAAIAASIGGIACAAMLTMVDPGLSRRSAAPDLPV
jgi:MFS family permease